MELKFFQFYFRQVLVIGNTYFAENYGMEKKKKKKRRMRTLFQDESLEFYCKGLLWIEKKIPSQYKGWNYRFSFTSFHLNSCRCPRHIQMFGHDLARIRVQCHYHCLIRFFGTCFLWQGQGFVCFNQEKKFDQILIEKNERIKMNWMWCIWFEPRFFSIVISLEDISVVRFSIVPSLLKLIRSLWRDFSNEYG